MLGWGRGESQDPAWQRVPTPFRGSRGEMRGSPRLSLGHGQVFSSVPPPKMARPRQNSPTSRLSQRSRLRVAWAGVAKTDPTRCLRPPGWGQLSFLCSLPPGGDLDRCPGPHGHGHGRPRGDDRGNAKSTRAGAAASPGGPGGVPRAASLPDRATATCLKARLPGESRPCGGREFVLLRKIKCEEVEGGRTRETPTPSLSHCEPKTASCPRRGLC